MKAPGKVQEFVKEKFKEFYSFKKENFKKIYLSHFGNLIMKKI